tara:strand:- start:14 stop:163 length:150 start_codon:yes stop_codon:yes gene_type:complete
MYRNKIENIQPIIINIRFIPIIIVDMNKTEIKMKIFRYTDGNPTMCKTK